MTTDNKLFESIINSGKEQAEAINKEAEEKAQNTLKEAEAEAEKEIEAINKAAEIKAQNMKNSALSSASLMTRNASLQAKRAEIDKTVNGIIDYILNLDDKSYFELLYKMAAGLELKSGTLLLNERDLKRLPSDFAEKMNDAGIKADVGDKSADITGGFILKNGDIEANCSLGAVIDERKNELEDFINQRLFTKEN